MTPPVRVLSSFKEPRATTNPYITMLHRALRSTPGLQARPFTWLTAIFGRYDVFHWHWPETRMQGSRAWKSALLLCLTAALLVRHHCSRRIVVVQTAHNVELPTTDRVRTWLLRQIASTVDVAVTLNDSTQTDVPQRVIPHGHYREWFAPFPHAPSRPGRIASFGQVRRYKGLETLIGAFAELAQDMPAASLSIGGKPTSDALAQDLRERAAAVPTVHLDLRFLSDADLVATATEAELVVLAYRFMHNSGSALAALSLDRPVLVPRNEVNARLAEEVGAGWVHLYDGDLDAADLRAALLAAAERPGTRPILDARNWDRVGEAHLATYRDALARARTAP